MRLNLNELKSENNAILVDLGIEVNPHLPIIESDHEVATKTAVEVARRLCAVGYVIGIGYDADRQMLREYLKKFDLWSATTDREREALVTTSVTPQERVNYQWMCEAAQALAWCLGLVKLDHFKDCDDDLASKIPFQTDPAGFIASATLKPIDEIQRQVDLLYRMHWYARDCALTRKTSKLNHSIITERRRAIDWVYGVADGWDEVELDT